jgi:hypothetical protein
MSYLAYCQCFNSNTLKLHDIVFGMLFAKEYLKTIKQFINYEPGGGIIMKKDSTIKNASNRLVKLFFLIVLTVLIFGWFFVIQHSLHNAVY